ncbi:MAG: SIMPL domain-containing protein [Fimbriimonadaceae bacterium]|nr:SIMPL domain-containing protein [Fimbriimonadaceae bacterium]
MNTQAKLIGLGILAIGLASVQGCTQALAQEESENSGQRRTISVSGSGSVRVKPDIATANVGASKTAIKLPEAKADCDAAIAKVRGALKKAGVSDDEIQTVQYQIYRVNANPQAGIPQSQWKVIHTMQIRTKKPDTIAGLVDIAVAAGATDVSSINFSVDSLAKHRTKARELAMAAAVDKAKQLAELSHVQLGRVISVTEQGDGYYPTYQMSSNVSLDYGGGGMSSSAISGGQVEVGTSTSVVFEIR